MKLLILPALALAAGGSSQAPQPAPRLERIEMGMSSWGRPVFEWSIDARGDGRHMRAEWGKPGVTRSFAAGTAGFRKIRVLLRRAERHAGRSLPCPSRITDAPYGKVHWVRPGGRISALGYDMGCRGSVARDIIGELRRAEAQVAAWAAGGPVIATKQRERR